MHCFMVWTNYKLPHPTLKKNQLHYITFLFTHMEFPTYLSTFHIPAVAVDCLPVVQKLLDDGLGNVGTVPTTHHCGDLVLEQ